MRGHIVRNSALLLVLAVAACGRGNERDYYEEALRRDLALASSPASYGQLPYVSGMEAGYMPQGGYAQNPYGYPVYQPVSQPAPRVVQPVYRAPAPAPAPTTRSGEIIQRNTGRDAAIGAAAGAVIGVATSRDKLKGAVIGAAAGGLLGAVIGHTVDVKRRQ